MKASDILEEQFIDSISSGVESLNEFSVCSQVHVVQLGHCYFRFRNKITLHFNVVRVEVASIVVVDYLLWLAAINVVLVLPAY